MTQTDGRFILRLPGVMLKGQRGKSVHLFRDCSYVKRHMDIPVTFSGKPGEYRYELLEVAEPVMEALGLEECRTCVKRRDTVWTVDVIAEWLLAMYPSAASSDAQQLLETLDEHGITVARSN